MPNETLLTIGGIFHIALAIFHLMFWRLFAWKRQLAKLQSVNRGAMQAMNIALIFIFAFFATLSLAYQQALLTSQLGQFILISIAALWFIRALIQIPLFGLMALASKIFFITVLMGSGIYTYIAYAQLSII